jgi:hypothetical protein
MGIFAVPAMSGSICGFAGRICWATKLLARFWRLFLPSG